MLIERATVKPETKEAHTVVGVKQATPWNQLEAGVLYALGLPLLVFREAGIEGGVFDLEARISTCTASQSLGTLSGTTPAPGRCFGDGSIASPLDFTAIRG
jgi:hypothetical protein